MTRTVSVPEPVLPVAPLLSKEQLAQLNVGSNGAAAVRAGSHLAFIVLSGLLWGQAALPLPLRLIALVALGVGLATCFAPMHECGHRTAFADRRLNDGVAWLAGLLSFYNATFTAATTSGTTATPTCQGSTRSLRILPPPASGATCSRSAAGTGGPASSAATAVS